MLSLRRRVRPPAHPSEEDHQSGLRAVLYSAELDYSLVSLQEVEVEALTAEQLLWVDVSGEGAMDRVADVFGLTDETVAALHEQGHDPDLFTHDSYVHVIVVAPGADEGSVVPRRLDCLVGPNWVITFHLEPIPFLDHLDTRMRGNTNAGRIDSHDFLAAILHELVASYLAELRPLEAGLDRVDLRALTGRIDDEALLRELVHTRVRLAKLRRLLEPHRELYPRLARSEFAVLSGSNAASDFEALTDLLERALQAMETTREMIAGSFEIYTTWTTHGTNKVMKRLTVASVTLLPPTLVSSVMGMNSLPGAFQTNSAFWLSTAAMASLAVSTVTLAWIRKWI